MDTFGVILVFIAFAIGGVVYVASRKPDMFHVERRLRINAPAEAIFAHIHDLEAWANWSPWARKDPNAKNTFGSVRKGVGASMRWEGNKDVGVGTMTITEASPHSRLVTRLDFEKPFKGTNFATFELVPSGGSTDVIWSLDGPATLVSKIMDLLMNMEKMIGRDYEAGLANLKGLVEPRA